ncbi:MAG: hypothetical protein WBY94_25120 [Polyangiaceae bacterium]
MEAFDGYALVVKRNRSLFAIAAIGAILGAGLVFEGPARAAQAGAFIVWVATGLLIHLWRRNPATDGARVRVHADSRGLLIEGRLRLEASRIAVGWLEPRRCGLPRVHLGARGLARDVTLAVPNRECGRALLRALRVDPTHVAAHSWALARPLAERRLLAPALTAVGLFLALGFVAGQSTAALALGVVALGVLLVGAATPTRVTVGADGLLIEWLGTRRFVAWSSISYIEALEQRVVLALEEGEWLTLWSPSVPELHSTECDVLLERINLGWRGARGRTDNHAAHLVQRAGGDTREWVRSVRGISTAWVGYRTVAVPADRLWGVVEDPTVDWTRRTGAALALGPSLDAQGRTRLRAAAASCAEPRVRLALKAAATASGGTADEEQLAAALDAIDGEEGPSAEHGSWLRR